MISPKHDVYPNLLLTKLYGVRCDELCISLSRLQLQNSLKCLSMNTVIRKCFQS
uniref:Uncharacterized protein n=1 Tax=Rhizophora mucronata TaxID=61149 RepID=A0A2P2NW88_RHIMU